MEQRERWCSTSADTPCAAGAPDASWRAGAYIEVVETKNGAGIALKRPARSAYRETVLYLFVEGRPVGGLREIRALDRSGALELLVRGDRVAAVAADNHAGDVWLRPFRVGYTWFDLAGRRPG